MARRWRWRPCWSCGGAADAGRAGASRRGAAAQGGEANLVLPDLSQVTFLGGIDGHTLLYSGWSSRRSACSSAWSIYNQLKNLPVHRSMLEISELIYETCKTYLIQQGKFLLILEVFIGIIIAFYFGAAAALRRPLKVAIILLFSLIGIAGSYGVAWFGIRVNTFANSRTAFASARGQAVPVLRDSAQGRHEHRHDAHQRRAAADARHPAVHPGRLRRARASSASRSASRSAPRRCASRAASSRRSPTSAPT